MTRPRHRDRGRTMLTAGNARRRRLQPHLRGREVQRPPPTPVPGLVVPPGPPATPATPLPSTPTRPHVHDQREIPVTIPGELGPVDDRAFDTQQPLQYPRGTHAVLRPVELTLDKPEP